MLTTLWTKKQADVLRLLEMYLPPTENFIHAAVQHIRQAMPFVGVTELALRRRLDLLQDNHSNTLKETVLRVLISIIYRSSDRDMTQTGWNSGKSLFSQAWVISPFKILQRRADPEDPTGSQEVFPHGIPGCCGELEKAVHGNLRYLPRA